ncbi:MAG: hypothetical protein IMX04_08485 [Candidatus Carbobacillus altaicus]|nr:hypothetical protein [Candidatus Carbobacillus altaicus]
MSLVTSRLQDGRGHRAVCKGTRRKGDRLRAPAPIPAVEREDESERAEKPQTGVLVARTDHGMGPGPGVPFFICCFMRWAGGRRKTVSTGVLFYLMLVFFIKRVHTLFWPKIISPGATVYHDNVVVLTKHRGRVPLLDGTHVAHCRMYTILPHCGTIAVPLQYHQMMKCRILF